MCQYRPIPYSDRPTLQAGRLSVHSDHLEGRNSEAGSVSVEFALGLVGVMSVFAMILGGLDAAHAQSQACQLARDSARHAALAVEEGAIRGLDGANGSVVIQREGQWVRAHAQWPLHSPVGWLASHVSCDIQTLVEPTEPW